VSRKRSRLSVKGEEEIIQSLTLSKNRAFWLIA
jgi:hypothetical protein